MVIVLPYAIVADLLGSVISSDVEKGAAMSIPATRRSGKSNALALALSKKTREVWGISHLPRVESTEYDRTSS